MRTKEIKNEIDKMKKRGKKLNKKTCTVKQINT